MAPLLTIKLNYNKSSSNTLSKYGNEKIISMKVGRSPIPEPISEFLGSVSKSKIPYDKLYHLFLVVETENGKHVYIEKNEVVSITTNYNVSDQIEYMPVSMNNKDITINQLLDNTLQKLGKTDFFTYKFDTLNCQHFVQSILKYNNLLTPKLNKFVIQDIVMATKDVAPIYKKMAHLATHTASLFNKYSGGKKYINKKFKQYETKNKHKYTDQNNLYNDWFEELSVPDKIIFLCIYNK